MGFESSFLNLKVVIISILYVSGRLWFLFVLKFGNRCILGMILKLCYNKMECLYKYKHF